MNDVMQLVGGWEGGTLFVKLGIEVCVKQPFLHGRRGGREGVSSKSNLLDVFRNDPKQSNFVSYTILL